ncbi:MAG: ProQ/FINO family protein [Holosporales bacterium]
MDKKFIATLDLLKERYTVIAESKPLGVGIHQNIIDANSDIKPFAVRRALQWHTGSPQYLKNIIEHTHRVHLDGSEAEPITEEQREVARKTLNEREERAQEIRNQRRQERFTARDQEALQRLMSKFARD